MKYIVFGSGGFSKEVIEFVEDDGHDVIEVISTETFNNADYIKKFQVNKTVTVVNDNIKFLLAVADPGLKRKLVSINSFNWGTFIHSSAHVSKYAKIDIGTIIGPHATVNADAIIGKFVTMNNYTLIAHDCFVRDYVTLSPYVGIMGNCYIGDDCFFGTASYCIPQVTLGNSIKVSAGSMVRHSFSEECTLQGNPAKPRA